MFALEDETAVDLVAQHHDVAVADRARDAIDVFLLQYATGRVLRRIQNDQLCPVVDQPRELIHVEPEIQLLAQSDRHSIRADVIDHRLVDWESGIGVDDLITFFHKRKNAKKDDGLTAGNNDHFFGRNIYPARLTHVLSDDLAQLR